MIHWLLRWLLLFEISTHGLGYHSLANVNACKSSQEILCSSPRCHANETFATLGNGRQLSCSVSYVPVPPGNRKGKETKGDSARPPESLQASCYKTYSKPLGRDKVAMDIAWEAKEEDVRKRSLKGFSLFIRGGEYRVSLKLKGRRSETEVAECIKFRYICYGVNNAYLSNERKSTIGYSVYPVPRSRLGDNKNGLSDIYIVPKIDQCRDSPYQRDETTTTTAVPTTTVDSLPYKDLKESGSNTAAVLGFVLGFIAIAAAICFVVIIMRMKKSSEGKQQQSSSSRDTQRQDEVIEKPKPIKQRHRIFTALTLSRQGRKSSTERQRSTPSGQLRSLPLEVSEIRIPHPMKILVVIDRTNKHICDKAHALVQNWRENSNLEIISNLENSNSIIYEQGEVSWYQKNSEWADSIIFINGVAVLRKLDKHRDSLDEFTHAIVSHFGSKRYSQKWNIFLEQNKDDLDYFKKESWLRCEALKFNKDLGTDAKFVSHLRSCVDEQASVGRQQEDQFRTSSV